ncbi:hypothetical protein PPYR_15575, partial [Photinus pyralis]
SLIEETCFAIWKCLKPLYLQAPDTNAWKTIAEKFNTVCHFPHSIGAIDGKHVIIEAPKQSGSTYYNYKGSHSINLFGVVDADLCFILVDIGSPGRQSDGVVFRSSEIGRALDNSLNMEPLPSNSSNITPYVFVGDEAFALTTTMMRPFPHK